MAYQKVFRDWLRDNHILLMNGIIVGEIIDEIYSEKIISHEDYENITSENTENKKTRKLLDILCRISIGSARKFLIILQHNLPYVFEDLSFISL